MYTSKKTNTVKLMQDVIILGDDNKPESVAHINTQWVYYCLGCEAFKLKGDSKKYYIPGREVTSVSFCKTHKLEWLAHVNKAKSSKEAGMNKYLKANMTISQQAIIAKASKPNEVKLAKTYMLPSDATVEAENITVTQADNNNALMLILNKLSAIEKTQADHATIINQLK